MSLIAAALAFTQLAVSDAAWLNTCVTQIEQDPASAYEQGMAWSFESRRPEGYQCAAMALVEMGRVGEGARRLEALGSRIETGPATLRAELLSQAGNAWLMAEDGGAAARAFTTAIELVPGDHPQFPDLLIDRARAFALAEDWRASEEDLSAALDRRPEDALALRLRAVARMNQDAFILAVADAEAAVRLAPDDVEALLVLGHAREARRTGAPVNPQ